MRAGAGGGVGGAAAERVQEQTDFLRDQVTMLCAGAHAVCQAATPGAPRVMCAGPPRVLALAAQPDRLSSRACVLSSSQRVCDATQPQSCRIASLRAVVRSRSRPGRYGADTAV